LGNTYLFKARFLGWFEWLLKILVGTEMNDCFLFLSVSGWGNKNYKLCYPGLMFKKKKPRGDILRGYMV